MTWVSLSLFLCSEDISEVFDEREVFSPESFLLFAHGTKPDLDSQDRCARISLRAEA